jgi:hypothetical protein
VTVLVKTTNWEYDALLEQDLKQDQELTEVRLDLLIEKPEVKKKVCLLIFIRERERPRTRKRSPSWRPRWSS